jgi:carbonic anhydrase
MPSSSDATPLSRRSLLKLGAGIIGASSLSAGWTTAASADSTIPQNTLSPDEALTKLMAGNQRFVARKWQHPDQDFARVTEVATGQAPFAAILSCADSRVVPEIAFDQGIGDLFVARVAGNVAIVEEIASEEYAIAFLGTPLLMVLGHERCGAVTAALTGGELPGALKSLVDAIQPAIKSSEGEPGDRLANAVKANVCLQVQRLQTSTVIAEAVKAEKLKVVGAYYDLDTGVISLVS